MRSYLFFGTALLVSNFCHLMLLSSICFETCVCKRTWYFSDEQKIYEHQMTPNTVQRELFDIRGSSGDQNGKICCLAVNYRSGSEIFVSDTGENRILRLKINADWSAVQPIREEVTILEDRVAYTLTFDDHNGFLFFATIDYIWRIKRDGSMLRNLIKLDDSSKVTSMVSNSLKSKLIWSTWRESKKLGQVFSSHTPLLSCTNEVLKANAKFEYFTLLDENNLYTIDSFNSRVLKLNFTENLNLQLSNISSDEIISTVDVQNVINGTTPAAGLFTESSTKLIYLDIEVRQVICCDLVTNCYATHLFVTQFTPTDLKLNLTRIIPSDVIRYEPKVIMRYQKYFFANSVVFYFDTDESRNRDDGAESDIQFAHFTYTASLQLLTSKEFNSSNSTTTTDSSENISAEVKAGRNNEFRSLQDRAKYRLNLSFVESECQESPPELLDSFVVCTEPALAYDFQFDGNYVFWKHGHEIKPSDWIIDFHHFNQSVTGSDKIHLRYGYTISVAIEDAHVIYRLDTRDNLQYNDSIHVIAQFDCEGNLLRSKAAKFAIEKIDQINQTIVKMFKAGEESVNDGAPKPQRVDETQFISLKLLFVSLVILTAGLVITLFNYFRKKSQRKFKTTKIDLKKLDENVERYSTLRDSMQSYATLTANRQISPNIGDDYVVDADGDNESIYAEIAAFQNASHLNNIPKIVVDIASDEDEQYPNEPINLPISRPSNVSTFLNTEPNYYSLIEDEIEEEPEDFLDDNDDYDYEIDAGEQIFDHEASSDSESISETENSVQRVVDMSEEELAVQLADTHIYSTPIKTSVV